MKSKRIVLVLVVSMLVSMVSYAGFLNFGKKKGKKDNKQLAVKMLYADNASYPYKEDWVVMQEIKEKTGVNFQVQPVPDSDYREKIRIIMNSGKMPEILCEKEKARPEDVANGLLLPINQYLDKMPNLKKFLEENKYQDEIKDLVMEDGNFYTLPVKSDPKMIRVHNWLIRKDIFEKHNMSIPSTLEEVYEAGLKLKKLYPESNPIINRFKAANIMSVIAGGFGTQAGWQLTASGYVYDRDNDNWKFAPASDEYKEFLMYMNKLYKSGVLDPEWTTLDSTAYEQRASMGTTFIFVDWVGNQVRYNNAGRELNPDFNIQPMMPPKGPHGDYATDRGRRFEQFWLLPASLKRHKRLDEVLAFIDWFYSDEGEVVTTFGKKDISYTEIDGRLAFIDILNKTGKDVAMEYGVLNNSLNARRHPDWFYAYNGKEIADLFDKMDENKAVLSVDPSLRHTEEELDELQFLTPGVRDYYLAMTEQFIFGKASFDEWGAYVAECEKKGSKKIGDIIEITWKRQNEKMQASPF